MASESRDRRRFLRRCGVVLASVGTAGCVFGDSSNDRRVSMTDGFAFDPETVRIEAGGTVTWTNDSDVGHTVTAYGDRIPDGADYFASGDFDSERAARNDVSGGIVDPGEEYEHTFEVAGTYDYFCIPHEGSGMVGTVEAE